ncbi:MAG: DEAD/DEAH box helicase family protein [Chloroflexota bacterium]
MSLKKEYRSGSSDIVDDFYVPCLARATRYDRAVGYFTGDGLTLAAQGLDVFERHEGRMRLVASPQLREDDLTAIERGEAAKSDIVEMRLLEALWESAGKKDSALRLAWLVAADRLEIRIAVPRKGSGIFHEKVGIFRDDVDSAVAFSGSANETVGGLVSNFESIDVFFSWDDSSDRVEQKTRNFEALWRNETPLLDVISLPQAVRAELVSIANSSRRSVPVVAREAVRLTRRFNQPAEFTLRPYQDDAVNAWMAAGGRGILSMATGTGKTETSLACAVRLRDQVKRELALVVVTPFIHLVDQWVDRASAWGLRPVRCYGTSDWRREAWDAVDTQAAGGSRSICLVSTISTAGVSEFQSVLRRIDGRRALLIADEVHHLGAEHHESLMDEKFSYRLGLSATPARWEDEAGTARLFRYFGPVVYEFGVRAAIAARCLSPYRYEPVLVDLDKSELETYDHTVEEIEHAVRERDIVRLGHLEEERVRVLNGAMGKLEKVREAIALDPPSRTLFYCASRRQLDAVSETLRAAGYLPRAFTAEEPSATRQELLSGFAAARIPALVAMKALDEGVDIPETREAYILASSGNPREFIQRRGRVLRLAPGKNRARIVDYVVVPKLRGEYERQLVEKELRRVLDFAASSMNPDAARAVIWPILDAYNLIHLVGEYI